ncbi:hypothetical protein [Devosia riboflavina]
MSSFDDAIQRHGEGQISPFNCQFKAASCEWGIARLLSDDNGWTNAQDIQVAGGHIM